MRCPSCEAEAGPDVRFCSQCGHRLDAPPAVVAAERRQLTVMFCDLVGSTQLSGQLDPEDLRDVLREYHDAATRAIRQYEGHVAEYLGDGLVVYFGYPVAHEDDAERAARAGLAIVRNMAGVNDLFANRIAVRLAVRVGIHTGLVVVGEVGARDVRGVIRIVGETPNVAARIQGEAPADGVAVTSETRSLLGPTITTASLGPRQLKGITGDIEVFQVIGEDHAPGRHRVEATVPIVDRTDELAALLAAWSEVRAGASVVVHLTGPAGMGKSKLLDTFRHQCERESVWVEVACSPYESATPLHPFLDVIGDVLETAPPGVSPALVRRDAHQRLLSSVREHGAGGPVVLAIEDAHWADASTLEMIEFARQAPPPGLLLVVTARDQTVVPKAGRSIELAPLAAADVEVLAESVAGGSLPRELRQELVARTDGVPLFATELVRALVESGAVILKGGAVVAGVDHAAALIPMKLQDSLMARIDRLGSAKPLAQLASVLGRTFREDVLRAVAAGVVDNVDQMLDALVSSHVVQLNPAAATRSYAFSHALLRDVAYESLLRTSRREHHRRIAMALTDPAFADIAASQPQVVAHHLTEAGLSLEAIEWWRLVAAEATKRGASTEAATALTTAREQLALLTPTAEIAATSLAVNAALGAALAAARGYGDEDAAEAYRRAQDLAKALPPTSDLFPVLFGLVAYLTARGEFAAAQAAGDQLLASAEESDDDGLRIEANYCLGMIDLYTNRVEQAVAHLALGAALYDPERHHDLAFQYVFDPGVACHRSLALALHLAGQRDDAIAHADRAIELANDLAHPFSHASALVFAAILQQLRGERAEVEQLSWRAVAVSEEFGFPFWALSGRILHGWAISGPQGLAEATAATERYESTGSRVLVPYWRGVVAHIHAELGDLPAARRWAATALDMAAATGETWATPFTRQLSPD